MKNEGGGSYDVSQAALCGTEGGGVVLVGCVDEGRIGEGGIGY